MSDFSGDGDPFEGASTDCTYDEQTCPNYWASQPAPDGTHWW